MADKAPCAYGVSGYVVVEKTQPARGGAGPTDAELERELHRIADKCARIVQGCVGYSTPYGNILAALREAVRLAPGATGATGGGA